MENPNKDSLIKSIAEIVVSDPKKVIGLLNRHGFKTNLDTNVKDLGQITIAAISKSKKFAEHLADMIIDGNFCATGNKKGTVILMGRTFGAKNPFFNAKGEGAPMQIEEVTMNNPAVEAIIDNNLLQNQIAIDKAIAEASDSNTPASSPAYNENVLGDSGMSIGVKIAIGLGVITIIVAGLKIAKVI